MKDNNPVQNIEQQADHNWELADIEPIDHSSAVHGIAKPNWWPAEKNFQSAIGPVSKVLSSQGFGLQLGANYLRYYPYLEYNAEGYTEGRYILPHVVDSNGIRKIARPEHVINGHVPSPNNSAFLQIIEMMSQHNAIDLSDIDAFFECGTAEAQTAIGMSAFFPVHTVEYLEEKYKDNLKKAPLKYSVTHYNGMAHVVLAQYLEQNPDQRLLILLDDHTPDYQAWIEEELTAIAEKSNRNDHIIIIDDLDHMGMGSYPKDQEELVSWVKRVNPEYVVSHVLMPDILYNCAGVYVAHPDLSSKEDKT